MPTYQIEMLWKCVQCSHSPNRGLAKHCVSCGFPKNEKCEEFFPEDVSENNAIRDADQLRLAQAGADWKCKYCSSLQSRASAFCSECGCNMETGEKPWQAKVKSITQDTVTGRKHENGARVEDLGHEHGGQVIFHGNAADDPVRIPNGIRHAKGGWSTTSIKIDGGDDGREQLPPLNRVSCWSKTGIAAAALLVLGMTLWLVFRTKIVDATVSDVSWEYRVLIDRYQVWHREGWVADNSAFDVRDLGPRIHHYDKVVSGSHQEPYSESYTCGETCTTTPRTCTSNKNGSATCTGGDRSCSPRTCTRTAYRTVTDYRDEPRYQDWYSWNVWDWGYNRTVTEAAHDFEPRWPKEERLAAFLNPGEQERQRREEHYKIVFTDPKAETYSIEPKFLSDFTRYPRGHHVRLKVGIAHGVEVLDK